ncbi:hypothetical protein E2L92_21985 [Salmonella enterica subsp. enterica serovar Ibadan]|nr:hypothetical protein [Salmonella enterica subsp. enterica serovar Ibadan]ECF3282123.1 hypothetical protein [Salmonella enterica subsp. enterica serovar Ibadan]
MKKLTQEIKDIALAQVMHHKDQAEGPRQNYLDLCIKSYLYEAAKEPRRVNSVEEIPENITPFVEPVLREAIKEAEPQLLDSFTSDGRIAVAFRSRGWNRHTEIDDLLTYNLNKIFLDEQDGYAVIEKAVHEALGPGSSFVKVFVDEVTNRDEATSPDWITIDEFMPLLADGWMIDPPASFASKRKGSVKGFEWKTINQKSQDQLGAEVTNSILLIRGTIPLVNVDKKIKCEFVDSRDLWIDTSRGEKFEDCRAITHRILTTVAEAKQRGYDPEKLKAAARMDYDLILQELSLTNVSDIEQDIDSIDDNEQKVFIYETYIYSSLFDKKGETKLYQVDHIQTEVLAITEIPFMPFVHAKAQSVTGQFFGSGFFQKSKPYQDALTKKYRQIDHMATMATWPRYVAAKGQYDRQALLNSNRPGAVVEVAAAGAIDYFPAVQIDQTFLTHYEMLRDSEKQSLRRGFGSANLTEIPPLATATIALSIYQDTQKGMALSKSFARTLIRPLYELIYKTMMYEQWPLKNKDDQPVEGVPYPNVYDLTIDINTPSDDTTQIMRLNDAITMAATLSQINTQWMSDENKYQIMDFVYTTADLPADKFGTDPATQDNAQVQEMVKEREALQQTSMKMDLQTKVLDQWKLASEIHINEQKAEEIILNGASDREIKQQESLTTIQKIMNDAQNKADKNVIENKRVEYDALLGVAERRHDNVVNGIM